MKRILRTLLAAAGILGLVTVGAVVFVTTFVDPEDLKPRLVEVVREQSGLQLELDGPLSWSFYPRLGVSVDVARVRLPAQGHDEPPFAAFEHGEVSLSFAPLLRREIAIDGLTIVGLNLNLERDEQGRGNWESLLDHLGEQRRLAESAIAPASAGFSPGGGDLDVNVNIASVALHKSRVHYADARSGHAIELDNLELAGTNVSPGSAFPLKGSAELDYFDALDAESASFTSQLTLQSSVDLGLTEKRHVLNGLSLKASSRFGQGQELQETHLTADQLELDLAADRLSATGSKLQAGLLYPQLGKKRLAFELLFALDANLKAASARVQELALKGPDGLDVSGNLLLEALDSAPRYSGQLQLAPLSLRKWLLRLNAMPNMAKTTALAKVGLTSPISGDLDGLTLDGLNMTLDDSIFSGRLSGDFDGRRLDMDLQGDSISLDDYLPSSDGAPGMVRLPGVSRAWAQQQETTDLLPAEWLADAALDLRLRLGELALMDQNFQNVSLAVEGRDGVHRLSEFGADFHSGELQASGELDAREDPLQWALSLTGQELRLGSLLISLGHEPPPVEGRLSGEGQLTSRGNSVPVIKRGLNGQLKLGIDEGRLTGTNISRELCTVAAALEGDTPSREWREGTSFEQASATIRLTDGVASSDDLVLNIPGIDFDGKGELDLGSEAFDLRIAARFSEDVDPACAVNSRLVGVDLPLRCQGQLGGDSSEWCSIDRDALQATLDEALQREAQRRFGDEAERRLDEAAEKIDQRLGEGAGSELRKAIKGLLE
ncbi:MAG TPA: AsmA family protein [Halomonas sp.]|nr:AsmA family protein [Halomonas sp.]